LRETVYALRQYSENDTIDQLLRQASAPPAQKRRVCRSKVRSSFTATPSGAACRCVGPRILSHLTKASAQVRQVRRRQDVGCDISIDTSMCLVFVSWAQVSRWKHRAEELEKLQRVASSPERSAFYSSSTSETEASHCSKSLDSHWMESGALPPSNDQGKSPKRNQEGETQSELDEGGDAVARSDLQEELSEAKETLGMMEEEVATAVAAAREQAVKRIAAESRVKSLQVKKGDPEWAETRKVRHHGIGILYMFWNTYFIWS